MSEEQDPSVEYIKAFNNGYTMRQHDPELLDKILMGNEKNEQLKAMKAGRQQYEREQFLKELEQAKEKHKDKERER